MDDKMADNKKTERILKETRGGTEKNSPVEPERLSAQRAEGSHSFKSRFISRISHQMRTPMNAIIGFSDVLSESRLSEEQRNHLDIIRKSARHMLKLINDIVDFSVIQADELDIEIADCSLGRLFSIVESLMRPRAKEKELKFEILQCSRLPEKIRTDPLRLRQCLIHLIDNAIKFTETGHVYVNVSLEYIGETPCVRFDIEDTGIGIAAERRDLIFQGLANSDTDPVSRAEGAGIGLLITNTMVRLLDGELVLSTVPGRGSVFTLTIPANVDVDTVPTFNKYELLSELDKHIDFSGDAETPKLWGRVLVAEDSKSNQLLVMLMLERLGLSVTIAEDGKEAVDKALDAPFDLIFMDMQMPNMNGYDATRLLRNKGYTSAIVALTAFAMKGDDAKCLAAGCTDYLSKPTSPKRLLEIVRKYLPVECGGLAEKVDVVGAEVDDLTELCSGQSCEAVIDWSRLVVLMEDEKLAEEIVSACVTDNGERLEQLESVVNSADANEVKMCAHAIKSSAATAGAASLSRAAGALEKTAANQDLSNAEQLVDDIKNEFEKLRDFVSKPNWVETAKKAQREQP